MASHGRKRRPARATSAAAAAVGLCLATVTTAHMSLAFHLHTGPRGIVGVGECNHAVSISRRRSATAAAAACRGASARDEASRLQEHDNDGDDSKSRREGGGGGAAKELSALLLSAMLLGNPQLSDAAATKTWGTIDPATQGRLIADLENRLLSIPSSAAADEGSKNAATTAAPATRAEESQPPPAAVDPPRVQPVFVPPSSVTGDSSSSPLLSWSTPAAAKVAPKGKPDSSSTRSPGIKLREYTFSIKLPEIDLPPVGPITVPAEGNVFAGVRPRAIFKAPSSERVLPSPYFPAAGAIRGALESIGKGNGVKELADAFAAAVPKQADYNRAVMEFEERVSHIVSTVDNPTFAPGVPLAPEFVSMLSTAKSTAFKGIRPYLPKGVEPELALFMLVTLPVLTVALRAADENSRRPKPAPLPQGYRPPRIVRFPNSPAKVDAEAVAEARKAREAQADLDAVAALRKELAARQLVAVSKELAGSLGAGAATLDAAALSSVKAAAAVEDLKDGVAAAVAADPEAMAAELARLRRDLSEAGKLTAKLDALERANARLMEQVADLSKRPSPGEIALKIQKEAVSAQAQKELEKKRKAEMSGMALKADKLNSAREALVHLFPPRDTDLAMMQDTEAEVPEIPETVVAEVTSPLGPASGQVDDPSSAGEKLVGDPPALEDVMEDGGAVAPKASKKPAAAKKSGAVKKPAAARKPAAGRKKATPAVKKAAPAEEATVTVELEETEALPTPPKKKATSAATKKAAAGAPADVSRAPSTHNGSSMNEVKRPNEVPVTPDDYADLSEDLARALGGVQGYDFDGLDLEMEDLGPEDYEELRNLEEMGDFDQASLEAEFDQDDESISQAFRMAAESALAHTSGGSVGRRIRTASHLGATSSRSVSSGSAAVTAVAERRGGAPQATATIDGGPAVGGIVGMGGRSPSSSPSAKDEFATFRKLKEETAVDLGSSASAAWGGEAMAGRGAQGGVAEDDGDWGGLSAKAVARKTVAELKEFLDEEGVDYPSKIKKAELVDIVVEMLAEA